MVNCEKCLKADVCKNYEPKSVSACSHYVDAETVKRQKNIVDGYATAARVIALHLSDFCIRTLPYDKMIAEAARRASKRIDYLETVIKGTDGEIKDFAERLKNAFPFGHKDNPSPCIYFDDYCDIIDYAAEEFMSADNKNAMF